MIRSSTPRLATLALCAVWVATMWVRASAAQDTKPAEAMKSTLTGVFTAAQAEKGRSKFDSTCVGGCHTMASHTGATFKLHWSGRSVFELFDVITGTMPDDDPGSLTPAEGAQLVAYILKLNGVQAGTTELPTSAEALKKIKIELPEK